MALPTYIPTPFIGTFQCSLSAMVSQVLCVEVYCIGSIGEACLPIPSSAYLDELAYWCRFCHSAEVFGKVWLHPELWYECFKHFPIYTSEVCFLQYQFARSEHEVHQCTYNTRYRSKEERRRCENMSAQLLRTKHQLFPCRH